MKELVIAYTPAKKKRKASVSVRYRAGETAQFQEVNVPFTFAVTDAQRELMQWYLESYLLFPWGEFNTRAKTAENAMRTLGVALFDAIFAARATNALYANISNDLPNTRIVIQAGDPVGIALPWELLYDSDKGEYGDIARLAHAFVRNQANLSLQPPPAPLDGATFNILMVICRPGGPEGDVPFQSVARPLLELFRPHRDRIRLDILRPPTFEQLARVLNDKPNFYHVVHFDGHGAFPHGGAAQGMLSFEGENGDTRHVTGAELGSLLAGKGVPMVLLNACQSGMTHPEAVYPSVGNELLKAGTRGVVAMAYSVYVQSAVRFMRRLYEGLVNGEELARAVALGRDELRSHPQRQSPIGDVPLQDWVVPVLFEADRVRLTAKSLRGLRLNAALLQDKQVTAGAEINCPPPPDFGFIGRDGPLLELERAFQKETVVLLQGMAGVGKTETAMGLARWQAETGALNGPIFFLSFEHHTPLAHVCDQVGQAFQQDIKQQLGVEWHLLDAEERRKLALTVLKQVPCLLIWDNFEPVHGFPTGTPSVWTNEEQQELRQFLSDLRSGETKVLLTSRRDEAWLGNIYRRVEMSGLKLSEAQELAVRVLERAGLNAAAIKKLDNYTDLLRYVQGNPLAIRAILPELKSTKPDVLLQTLQTGTANLPRDDIEQGREHSLAASLTYRLDQLDPTLRQRLGVLSLFQGFVTANFLAELCRAEDAPELLQNLQNDEWIVILDAAAEVGLVRNVGAGYYTMHPALPWFFHDLQQTTFADQTNWLEQAFAAAYGSYGLFLRQSFAKNAEITMNHLVVEESNLLYALRIAQQNSLWDTVSNILHGLNQLLTMQGRWVEWQRLLKEAETRITNQSGEPIEGGESLWMSLLGHHQAVAAYLRDFDTQKVILLRLKEHYERAGEERNIAAILHQLGTIANERRNFSEAENCYKQSLAIKERIGDEQGQARSLHQLGITFQQQRDFTEAERWYNQGLTIDEHLGNEYGQAICLYHLGMIAVERRDFAEAKRLSTKSLAIKERIGDEQGQARSLLQLGRIAIECAEYAEAEYWSKQSLAIAERISNEYGQAIILHQLGQIAYLRQAFVEAERWYKQSLAIDERIGDEQGQAIILHNLGRVAEERRNSAEAIRFYERAEVMFIGLDDPYNLEIVRNSLLRICEQQAESASEPSTITNKTPRRKRQP